jgi:hypothetical protein
VDSTAAAGGWFSGFEPTVMVGALRSAFTTMTIPATPAMNRPSEIRRERAPAPAPAPAPGAGR